MTTPLRIPRRYEGGLVKVRDLSDGAMQELLSALQEAPSTINEASISAEVAAKVDTIARSDLEEIVPSLLSLYSLKDVSEFSISEVAERVTLGMEESGSKELRLNLEDRHAFRERLVELLSLDSLNITVKAGNLLFQQEHSLQQARIVTDIRPVFEPNDPEAPPKGALVVHTLKISYYDDNELKDFFVSFDTSDVDTLLDQLGRANAKAKSLKAVLAAAKVRYINVE